MDHPIPITKRNFRIFVEGISDENSPEEYFYSVDGLEQSVIFTKENFIPGGTSSPLETPTAQKAGDLTIRRPLMEKGSKITQWCAAALNKLHFMIRPVQVMLLNGKEDVVAQWLMLAYPINIGISRLGLDTSSGNEVVEETITLRYEGLERIKPI